MTHTKPFDTLEDHAMLGFDPGKMTGAALWVPSLNHTKIYATGELTREEIREWTYTHLAGLPHVRICVIAMENFVQAPGAVLSAQPETFKVIGVLRTLADELTCSLTTNSAGAAKKLANNARLRRIGWYRYTKDGHENDAKRQILTTMARFHKDLFRDLIQDEENDAAR